MKQTIELRKLRDFGQVISDTFIFFKENFKVLIRSLLIICGVFLLIGTTTTVFTYMNMGNMLRVTPDTLSHYTTTYYISVFFNYFALALSQFCIHLVTLSYISVYLQKGQNQPTFPEVWEYFKYYFFRVLGSGILILLMIIAGICLCVIPGIYLMPIMYLIIPIIVIENSSFSYAFNKSFRLIKDNWWFTLGVIFVMGLIIGVASSLASFPLTLIALLGKFLSLKSFTLPLTILFSALQNLIFLGYCLPSIAITLCYFDLNEQKEGTGLLSRINNFGKNTGDTSALPAEEY